LSPGVIGRDTSIQRGEIGALTLGNRKGGDFITGDPDDLAAPALHNLGDAQGFSQITFDDQELSKNLWVGCGGELSRQFCNSF
jgi:hypothetical protein